MTYELRDSVPWLGLIDRISATLSATRFWRRSRQRCNIDPVDEAARARRLRRSGS